MLIQLYNQKIPSTHITHKVSQVIPEQTLSESVTIYSDAIPYVECMIQSTIQHEAAHRGDEESRNDSILKEKQNPRNRARAAQVMPFDQFSNKSRVEPIAEKEEESCDSLLPPQFSGETTTVQLNDLFEKAKTASDIDPQYKQSIKAGHLPPEAQGMYLMKDFSGLSADELVKIKQSKGNAHIDEQNNLWIDVRKIVSPFIVSDQSLPATYQGQGDGAVSPDVPGVSRQPPQGVQSVPPAQSVQGVPAIPAR